MIDKTLETLIMHCNDSLFIPASSCATVNEDNNLLHALLLLSGVGYSEIPVLNAQKQIVGAINMPLILQGIKTETEYLWDELEDIKVAHVMRKDFGRVADDLALEDILHQLVNHNYLSIVGPDGEFRGIITRKEMFTRFNFLCHQINTYCNLTPLPDFQEKFRELEGKL